MPAAHTPLSKETRGYIFALSSSVFLSTTAIFIRHLTLEYQLPALVLAFWRDVFVVLTLLLVLGLARPRVLRAGRQQTGYLILHGLTLAGFNAFWTLSVSLNGAAVATVLVYCSTAFTVLFGYWLLKESLTLVKMVAVILCLGGCVLVAEAYDPSVWHANPLGIITGIVSGLFYAMYTMMGRRASQRGLNPWAALTYTFGIAAVFLFLGNLLPIQVPGAGDLLWLDSRWMGWLVLILLAAGPTVAGFGLYNVSLTYLPSSVVNLIVTLEPPFTALFAFLAFGERLKGLQAAGGLFILGGVIFLRLFEGRAERKAAPAAVPIELPAGGEQDGIP